MVNRRALTLTLVTGLLIAGSAFVLVNEAFQPVSLRFRLSGRDASATFRLDEREPLFLEYELIVRAPGRERPAMTVALNDLPVQVPAVASAYLTQRARVRLPLDAIRQRTNVLRVRVGGDEANTFDMHARIQNYSGIAPDFPRAAVVGDDAVVHRFTATSMAASVARLGLLIGLCTAIVWLLGRIGRPLAMRWPEAHVVAVAVGPIAAIAYSAGRPLHLWLSPEAFVVLALVPWLFVQLAAWVIAHRATAVAVVAPVVVTLVVLEAALRFINYVTPIYVFYSDSAARFRGQPGARHYDATFNSRGFNDRERAVARPGHVSYRVVALGDSFVVGVVPQRENFLSRVEAQLSTRAPVEVINMGVAGTDPQDYLSVLADEGLAYRPDLVLVNLFIGNDLEGRQPRWHERSYLATLARALWRIGQQPATLTQPAGEGSVYDDNAAGMSQDAFMEVQVDRSWIYERDSARVSAGVARTAGFVRQMRDLTRGNGADVLVTLMPDESQIDSGLRDRVSAARELFPEQFDWKQPNQLLTEALAAEQIEVLDLLPAMLEAARKERLYKPADTHWNLAGNRVAAEAIANALANRVARHSRRP